MIRKVPFIISLFYSLFSIAQTETVVSGKIFEKGKQDVLPFVSIYFKGTNTGVTSDFEGNFMLKTSLPVDTLVVSYIGYFTRYLTIKKHTSQILQIELEPNTNNLNEVVIRPGINPALRIIKLAQQNREKNSYENLSGFDYLTYNKQAVSMNNISEKMKEQTLFAPIRELFDTLHQMKNEDGKYILPVFISETSSHYYQRKNPSLSKDVILANTINGFGAEKQSYVIDIIGTSVMQFNFNQNWIRYLAKDFISPIADNCMDYYLYTLIDSTEIDGLKCYEIQLNLKREEDLGFLGTIWIADSAFALKRVDIELAKSANINFIDRFRMQQELQPTEAGPWLPKKTRTIVDIAQMSKNSSGLIIKMYSYNSGFVVNQPKPESFYDVPIDRSSETLDKDSVYWQNIRPEPYSATESLMLNRIDSVKKIPAVKTYIDVARLILEGHYRKGKIDIGPYLLFVGYNEVENLRLRFGFRTNRFFSDNWYIRTYVAYGVKDEKFKYGLSVDRIINHKHWTYVGISCKNDYDILGITDASSMAMTGRGTGNLFATLNFAAPNSRLNKTIDYRFYFFNQPKRDWMYRITLNNTYFEPVGKFVFAYHTNPNSTDTINAVSESFTTTAITGELRFAYKELLISRGVDRIRITRPAFPALSVLYSIGIKGILNSQFNYNKIQFCVEHHLRTGAFGNADFRIITGKIIGSLPYPLLDVARGNSTILYNDNNYGLMNLYEFVSDQYSHFSYIQHFEGFFTNKIPVIRNLHLRNYGFLKMCYGHLSDANRQMIPATNESGQALSPIYEFKNTPYAEIGFGFENIFRFIQLGYVKRLSYLNNVNVRSWGITVGVSLNF